MKKLSLLLFVLLCYACEDDLATQPDGSQLQVAEIIDEEEVDATVGEVFHVVEDMPSFPGGMEAYNSYLAKNLNYPKQARDKGIEGRVFLSFIVNEDGSLSDLQILRGIGGGCDEEALRVYLESPNWKPGKQRGKIVKTKMQAAITFKLNDENSSQMTIEEVEVEIPVVKESESN